MTRRPATSQHPLRRRAAAWASALAVLASLVAGALVAAPSSTAPASADTSVTVPMNGPVEGRSVAAPLSNRSTRREGLVPPDSKRVR